MNYRNIEKRIDRLDGGNINHNEKTLFIIPVGADLPPECDPAKHSVIWDRSHSPRAAIGFSRNQLKEVMARIDGNSRTLKR